MLLFPVVLCIFTTTEGGLFQARLVCGGSELVKLLACTLKVALGLPNGQVICVCSCLTLHHAFHARLKVRHSRQMIARRETLHAHFKLHWSVAVMLPLTKVELGQHGVGQPDF